MVISVFLMVANAFFGYSATGNLIAILILTLGCFMNLFSLPARPQSKKSGRIADFFLRAGLIFFPILFATIIIRGDIRSWLLVIIATFSSWILIGKEKTG